MLAIRVQCASSSYEIACAYPSKSQYEYNINSIDINIILGN